MLDGLQKDTCTLSDSFQLWNSVISAAPIEYSECVAKRAEMALIPLVFAANLLDHRHHGNMLTPLETAKAVEYIKEVAGEEMLPELTKYMGKTSPYTEYLFGEGYKKVEPSAWWSSGSKLGFDQNFIDFAKTLVDAVASSAGLERCFSTLGFTYGKLRASMEVEKAGKLAFLFKQLNK